MVLARDLIATASEPLDERHLLTRLANNYSDCWVFAVNGLIGATPELLLRREYEAVSARLLAGTAWPEPGGTGRSALARELMTSAKNRAEHHYGIQSLIQTLAPFCEWLDMPAGPTVLHLPNVSHLATDVRGRLAADTPLLGSALAQGPAQETAGIPARTTRIPPEELCLAVSR